jgi:hypothetical protein
MSRDTNQCSALFAIVVVGVNWLQSAKSSITSQPLTSRSSLDRLTKSDAIRGAGSRNRLMAPP